MFLPGSELSPHALDAAMRDSLADSLAHIHAAASRPMNVAEAVLAEGLSTIKAHRVGPGVFGRYHDVVIALQQRRYEHAGTLFREITALADEEPSFAPVPFTEEALGPDKERYARIIGLETASAAVLASPSHEDWLTFEANVAAAMELIAEADAALAAELRALVVEVVAVGTNSGSGSRPFAGASSLMLWGGCSPQCRKAPHPAGHDWRASPRSGTPDIVWPFNRQAISRESDQGALRLAIAS